MRLSSRLCTNLIVAASVVSQAWAGASESLNYWQWRSPSPQGNHLRAVAVANGRYFAGGRYGAVINSADATNWVLAETRSWPARNDVEGIAYGQGQYVAAATYYDGTNNWSFLSASSNGVDWAAPSVSASGWAPSLAFGNERFLAAFANGVGFQSTDGLNWSAVTLPATAWKVAFLNGQFFSFGQSFSSSTNGTDWVVHTTSVGPGELADITYANGVWIATGYSYATYQSIVARSLNNGTNWTFEAIEPLPPNQYNRAFTAVAYGASRFVVLGFRSESNGDHVPYAWTSTDGDTWDETLLSVLERATDLLWDGQRFVAVGWFGAIAQSPDGETWMALSDGNSRNYRNVAFINNQFVAVGNDGLIARSSDGVSWTRATSAGTTANVRDVTYRNGLYVALAGNGRALTSYEADTWTVHTTPATIDVFGLAYGHGQFIAVGGEVNWVAGQPVYSHIIMGSTNGSNWISHSSHSLNPAGYQLHDVAYGDGLFVAVGRPGIAVTSPDGLNWSRVTVSTIYFDYLKSVAYGNGRFVAVGDSTNAHVFHGGDWTTHVIGDGARYFASITFANGQFVAVGERGIIYASESGVAWVRQRETSENDLRGIAYGVNSYVAVGNNNTIVQTLLRPRLAIGGGPSSRILELSLDPMRTYHVQYATDIPGVWLNYSNVFATHWQTNIALPPLPATSNGFFRVVYP